MSVLIVDAWSEGNTYTNDVTVKFEPTEIKYEIESPASPSTSIISNGSTRCKLHYSLFFVFHYVMLHFVHNYSLFRIIYFPQLVIIMFFSLLILDL